MPRTNLQISANQFYRWAQLITQAEAPKDFFLRQWNQSRPRDLSRDILQLTGNKILGTKLAKLQGRLEKWAEVSGYNLFVADFISYERFGTSASLAQECQALFKEIKTYPQITSNPEILKNQLPHLYGLLQFINLYSKVHQKWTSNSLISVLEWSILIGSWPDKVQKRLIQKIDDYTSGGEEKQLQLIYKLNDLFDYFEEIIESFEYQYSNQENIAYNISKIEKELEEDKKHISEILSIFKLEKFNSAVMSILDVEQIKDVNHFIGLNQNLHKQLKNITGFEDAVAEQIRRINRNTMSHEVFFSQLEMHIKNFFGKKYNLRLNQAKESVDAKKVEYLKKNYKKLFNTWLSKTKTAEEFLTIFKNYAGIDSRLYDSFFEKLKRYLDDYFYCRDKQNHAPFQPQNEEEEKEQAKIRQFFQQQKSRLTSQHNGAFIPELIYQLDIFKSK